MSVPTLRLAVAVASGYTAIGAGIQVLPQAAETRFGAASWEIGLAITAASLAAVVARPLAGRRADAVSPRPVVVLGGVLGALGAAGQLLAPSLWVLVAARLLIGAGEGALFTAAITWVLTSAPVARRGRIVGRFGLSMWGGLALGPPLASALAAATSVDTVWWACAAAPILPALALAATGRGDAPGRGTAAARGAAVLVPREVVRPGAALGLAAFGYGTLNAFLVLRFREAGFDGAGVALGVFGGVFLLARLAGSGLVDRVAARALVASSAAVEAGGLAVLAAAPGAAAAFAGVALCGLGTALVYPALTALVSGLVAADRRGAAVGALTSSWDAGLALAGPVGGAIAAVAGLRAPFVLAALAALTVLRTRPADALRRSAAVPA